MLNTIPQDIAPCPRCPTGVGVAVGVMVASDVINVMFRCGDCQHEWTARQVEPRDPPEKPDAA